MMTIKTTRLTDLAAALTARDAEIEALKAALSACAQGKNKDAKMADLEAALTATLQDLERQKIDADLRKGRIEALEARIRELEHKQRQVGLELRRSEGQISLITDLLLRGGGL